MFVSAHQKKNKLLKQLSEQERPLLSTKIREEHTAIRKVEIRWIVRPFDRCLEFSKKFKL